MFVFGHVTPVTSNSLYVMREIGAFGCKKSEVSSFLYLGAIINVNLAEKRLEHDQGPDDRAAISSMRVVLIHQFCDRWHVKISAVCKHIATQRAFHALAQRAAEPGGKPHIARQSRNWLTRSARVGSERTAVVEGVSFSRNRLKGSR